MVIVCNMSLFNKYGWMAFVCYFENSKGTSMTQTEALRLALEALEYEAQKGNDNAYQFEREVIKAALEAKDEPVAWADKGVVNWIADKQFMREAELFTHPPQRTWVGLTADEYAELAEEYGPFPINQIEAKLKQKNCNA
jgi:hypothetical protein